METTRLAAALGLAAGLQLVDGLDLAYAVAGGEGVRVDYELRTGGFGPRDVIKTQRPGIALRRLVLEAAAAEILEGPGLDLKVAEFGKHTARSD